MKPPHLCWGPRYRAAGRWAMPQRLGSGVADGDGHVQNNWGQSWPLPTVSCVCLVFLRGFDLFCFFGWFDVICLTVLGCVEESWKNIIIEWFWGDYNGMLSFCFGVWNLNIRVRWHIFAVWYDSGNEFEFSGKLFWQILPRIWHTLW